MLLVLPTQLKNNPYLETNAAIVSLQIKHCY